jgi:hypothetical protein
MSSIPVLLYICLLCALASFFSVWAQRANHSRETSRLQTNHADEISRLQRIHSDAISRLEQSYREEISRQETSHAKEISRSQESNEARVESAYQSGRASTRPHVFKGEEQTGSWFWRTKHELALAVVLDENNKVLAFAGDGSKVHSLEMAPELKKAIGALSGTVVKALASIVV